jgi:hypothetical protein
VENLSVFVVKFLIAVAIIAGLYWLIHVLHWPKWLNGVLDILIVGSFIGGNKPRGDLRPPVDDDEAVY